MAAPFSPALSWREPVPHPDAQGNRSAPLAHACQGYAPRWGASFFHTSNHCNLALLYIFALMDKYCAAYAPRRAIRSSTTAVMAADQRQVAHHLFFMAALSFPVLVWVTTLYHIPSHFVSRKIWGKTAGRAGLPPPSGLYAECPPAGLDCPASAPGGQRLLQLLPACGWQASQSALIIRWVWRNPQGALRLAGRRTGRRIPGPHKQHRVRWYPPSGHSTLPYVSSGVGFSPSKICSSKHPSNPQPGQKRLLSLPAWNLSTALAGCRGPAGGEAARPAPIRLGPTLSVSRSRRANWNRSQNASPSQPIRRARYMARLQPSEI